MDVRAAEADKERLRAAVHDYFESHHNGGCVHFDKGFGPYAQCEDPRTDVPIGALRGVFDRGYALDADRLAEALIDCGLLQRGRTHIGEPPPTSSPYLWARAIAAAYNAEAPSTD